MIWLIIGGVVAFLLVFVLYSCLIVAAREDRAMEKYFKEKYN